MRCDCCNRKLNDYETTLRHGKTNAFLNTCLKCLDGLGIPFVGREDLEKPQCLDEEDNNWEAF